MSHLPLGGDHGEANKASRKALSYFRHGFTLVEILAAIAVVCILAVLLFTGGSKALMKSKMAVCVARQRQMGIIFQNYANDHDNCLIQTSNSPSGRWPLLIKDYIGMTDRENNEVYRMPMLKDPTVENWRQKQYASSAQGIFGFNIELEDRSVRLVSLSKPSTFPVLATSDGDYGAGMRLSGVGPSHKAELYGYEGSISWLGPSPNFGCNQAIFLFADWHVEAVNVCDPDAWPWNDPDAFKVR